MPNITLEEWKKKYGVKPESAKKNGERNLVSASSKKKSTTITLDEWKKKYSPSAPKSEPAVTHTSKPAVAKNEGNTYEKNQKDAVINWRELGSKIGTKIGQTVADAFYPITEIGRRVNEINELNKAGKEKAEARKKANFDKMIENVEPYGGFDAFVQFTDKLATEEKNRKEKEERIKDDWWYTEDTKKEGSGAFGKGTVPMNKEKLSAIQKHSELSRPITPNIDDQYEKTDIYAFMVDVVNQPDYEETLKRGWNYGSSEAHEDSGIDYRYGWFSDRGDMQKYGNPLIYLTDGSRVLSGTDYEQENYGEEWLKGRTEAQYFGKMLTSENEAVFEGLLTSGLMGEYKGSESLIAFMTQDERDVFTYLYMSDVDYGINHYSESSAKNFFDALKPRLEARRSNHVSDEMVKLAKENPAAALAVKGTSLLYSSAAGPKILGEYAQKAINGEDGSLNSNDLLFVGENINSSITTGLLDEKNEAEKFVIGIGISAFDNLVRRAASFGTPFSAVMMGGGAFTSSSYESAVKNIEWDKSFFLASAKTAAEFFGEAVNIKTLDDAKKSLAEAFLNSTSVKEKTMTILKSLNAVGLKGALEESATEVMSIGAELLILGNESSAAEYRKKYLEEHGDNEQTQALLYAGALLAGDIIEAGASGYFTEILAGGFAETNALIKRDNYSDVGKTGGEKLEDSEITIEKTAMDVAPDIGEDSETYRDRSIGEAVRGKASDSIAVATERVSTESNTTHIPEVKTAKTDSKKGRATAQMLDEISSRNETVTVEEVKSVSGLGDNGSQLVAELANTEGATYSQAKKAVTTAYMAARTGVEKKSVGFETEVQEKAFDAGMMDRHIEIAERIKDADNATVYDGDVEKSEYYKMLPRQAKKMAKTLAKDFGMSVKFVDRLVYEVYEANAQHEDGVLTRANNSDNKVHEDLIHEALHRMMQVAPEETGFLLDTLYEQATQSGRAASLGVDISAFDLVKKEHDKAGISMNTLDILEEIGAREIQTIFDNAKEFNKWRARLDTDANLNREWKKVVEFISELIEKIKTFVSQMAGTSKEKAKAQEVINVLERYADAYKATMKAVDRKNSQKDGEVEGSESYNGDAKSSLKAKNKHKSKSAYNEYYSLGMQWAYKSSTKIGDQKILYKSSIGKYVLVEATKDDVGFIELQTGTYELLKKDVDIYESNKRGETYDDERAIDTAIHNFELGQNNDTGNHVNVGHRGEGIRNAEVSEGESDSNRTRSPSGVKENSSEVGKKKFSLQKWHTGLTKAQVLMVEERVNNAGKPEARRITDTAFWYKGRLAGKDLFVIYSTEDSSGATILYASKGDDAKKELSILLKALEAIENERSDVERTRIVNEILVGDWVYKEYNLANNNVGLGGTQGNIGNASIHQGKSSEFIGSPAFREVIRNLFEIQEVPSNGRGIKKNFSLKVSKEATEQRRYSDKEYQDYGWARENNILSAGQNEDYRAKFAQAVKGYQKFNKSKNGEYIIPVSDIYDKDFEGINNVLVFAKGTIDNPKITSIIEIDLYDETNLDDVRREIYAFERRGIQQKAGQFFRRYSASDYASKRNRTSFGSERDNSKLGSDGRGSGKSNSSLNGRKRSKIDYSLKGGRIPSKETTAVLDAVDDLKNGKIGASEKLSNYVEKGMISTEVYQEMIERFGAIPKGEKPYRDVSVPAKTDDDKKVSQTVRTILEAKATPEEAIPAIEKMVEDGVFSYDVYTDKQAIKDAEDYVGEYGWTESLHDWLYDVEKGVVSKQNTAMGWALYNNAANTAATTNDENTKKTAVETSIRILNAMVEHQRSAAQALQATRILKKLSPETQLYGIQKSVSAMQKELIDRYGKKAPDLKIDKKLAEDFLKAETQEERDAAAEEIYKDIGKQIPSRFADKWNAWRYLAMLGNPRTHIRNIAGNAGFAPIVAAKDFTATAIEAVVYRVSGKKMLRGKSLIIGTRIDRQLLKAAWNDYANVADVVSNGGKYSDFAMANKSIEEGRRIFKFKPLEMARKGNSKLLEAEDVFFSKPHYAYALAMYCKANNISPEQISKGKAIEPARQYAVREAQKATYKDTNSFSHFVSNIGKGNDANSFEKGVRMIADGILPFRKTPANILARGVEYSPIGLLKSLSYDLVQVSKGSITATEAIDNISAGLTGTGLVALGAYLAAQGLVRGHGEDDEEKEFKELMGHRTYSLELPDGASITLDWLAPEALPFFVGVNLWETTKGNYEKANLSSILSAVTTVSEPMLEMSCLQGLNDLFEGIGYASSNDTSGLMSILTAAATSYLSQGIPTLLGQAERATESERMTTYTQKNDFLTTNLQRTLGKWSAKIPFWDYQQIPYINAWGQKEASGSALKRGFNNFLNPAYTSTIKGSNMEKELLRLYEQTGEDSVFPSRAAKYFTVDGKRKDLTADEYVRYATLKGEKAYELVSDLVKSKAYKSLDDNEKVKVIEEAYEYADQKAKKAVSNYKPSSWISTADKFEEVEDYLLFRADVSDTKADNGNKITKAETVNIILDTAENNDDAWLMYLSQYNGKTALDAYSNGIDAELFMTAVVKLDEIKPDYRNGKPVTGSRRKKVENFLKSVCRTDREYFYLLGMEFESVRDDYNYVKYFGN